MTGQWFRKSLMTMFSVMLVMVVKMVMFVVRGHAEGSVVYSCQLVHVDRSAMNRNVLILVVSSVMLVVVIMNRIMGCRFGHVDHWHRRDYTAAEVVVVHTG
jgi:hypothetical protein